MRILISLLMLAASPLAVRAQVRVLSSDETGLTLEYNAPDLKTVPAQEGGGGFHRLGAEGCYNTVDCGRPALPQASVLIAVPPHSNAVISGIERNRVRFIPVIPLPASPPYEVESSFKADREIYGGKGQYPARPVQVSATSLARNNRVATVTFYPAVFQPAKGGVEYSGQIRVRVDFKPSGLKAAGVAAGMGSLDGLLYKALANPEQARDWSWRSVDKASQLSGDTLPYRIRISRQGIYRVGYDDLVQAGIDPSRYDPRRLKLVNRGKEIPLYFKGQADGIFDPDDFFEFWGEETRGDSTHFHQYTQANIYYLSLTGSLGARMVEEDAASGSPGLPVAAYFPDTIHFEKDSLFYRLASWNSNQNDRWFWRRLDYPDSTVFPLEIPSPHISAGDSFLLEGALHGITVDEHRIQLWLNGRQIGELTWLDQREMQFSLKFPASYAVNGINRLTIRHGASSSTGNRILINWFKLAYRRAYQAQGGALSFRGDPRLSGQLSSYRIGGLEGYNYDLYKLGISRITGALMEPEADGLEYALKFDDRDFGQSRYHLVRNDLKLRLSTGDIESNAPSDLRDPAYSGATYIVVAPRELEAAADRLVSARSARYPGARKFLIQDIYDEFGCGIPSDAALRDFISYAFSRWAVQPEYVLLLGDGSYDPRRILGGRADMLPVHLTRADFYGGVADDDYYARVSGEDLMADLSVGRLPVNSMEEFGQWEAKSQIYDQRLYLDRWHREVLMVAGWPLNAEDDFHNVSSKLAARIDPAYEVSKVYHGPTQQNKEDLIARLSQGAAVTAFYGHGGGQLWSHGTFFWHYDVPRLSNWGRWPLIGSFTCSSGAFESPAYSSLSEAFLLNRGGGIGVFSSSGASYGDSIMGCLMQNSFMDAWDRQGLRNFGDIALYSKWNAAGGLPPSGQTMDMLVSYNLLGDPATRLALPEKGLSLLVSPASVAAGDSIRLDISGPFGSGTAVISLLGSDGRMLVQQASSCPAATFQTALLVPDSAQPGQGLIRVYIKDHSADWAGSEWVGISQPMASGIKVFPETPTDLDSISLSARISSQYGVDTVWCRWRWGSYQDTTDTGAAFVSAPMMIDGDSVRLASRLYLTGLEGNFPPWSEVYLIFRLVVQDTAGLVTPGKWERRRLVRRADLAPSSQAQGSVYLGGKRVLQLTGALKNLGDLDASNVPVHFHHYGDNALMGMAVADTVRGRKERKFSLAWPYQGPALQIYYRIDPSGTLSSPYPQEDTTNDNSAVYWVPHQDFYYYQLDARGCHPDTLDYKGLIRALFPDSCLSDSAVAIIGPEMVDPASPGQPGLTPLDGSGQAYFVGLTDSSRLINRGRPFWVFLKLQSLDSTAALDRLKLFRRDDPTGMWRLVPSWADSQSLWGYSESPGTFRAMYTADTSGPQITARVDRQALGWGQTVVVPNPQYSVTIEDSDGVNPDSIWVRLDHQLVDRSAYALNPGTGMGHTVSLSYAPSLDNGLHSLEFGAADNLGNRDSLKIFSQVKVEFSLREIANYPNPVTGDLTTFYLCVGDYADRYELQIFTVAGRLIKTIRGGRTSGVRTFEWDLTDESGARIANGVYFYRFRVFQGGKQLEKTGKLAVLR